MKIKLRNIFFLFILRNISFVDYNATIFFQLLELESYFSICVFQIRMIGVKNTENRVRLFMGVWEEGLRGHWPVK